MLSILFSTCSGNFSKRCRFPKLLLSFHNSTNPDIVYNYYPVTNSTPFLRPLRPKSFSNLFHFQGTDTLFYIIPPLLVIVKTSCKVKSDKNVTLPSTPIRLTERSHKVLDQKKAIRSDLQMAFLCPDRRVCHPGMLSSIKRKPSS